MLEEGVDLLGVLAEAVLDVDFLRLFAGEGRDEGEGGEVGGELLSGDQRVLSWGANRERR